MKMKVLIWAYTLTIREKGFRVDSYQKYLQHKFIIESGAIFCFKTFRIFGI